MVRSYRKRKTQKVAIEIRPGRKRISLDVPTVLHDMLLDATFINNCTMTVYIIRALRDRLRREGIEDE
jgi:hypothetical protein